MPRLRDLFAFEPARSSRATALRLDAPVFIALLGFAAAGRFMQGLLVALGAYIVLFGAGEPGPRRLRTFAIASVGMLAAMACGALVAGSAPWTTVAYMAVALVAVAVALAWEIGAPGPYFFVLMVGGGTLLAGAPVPLAQLLAHVLAGNLLAIGFGMADLWRDRHRAERSAIEGAAKAVQRLRAALEAAPASALAATRQEAPALIDGPLRRAAAALTQAWDCLLAGAPAGHGGAPQPLQDALLALHRQYRQLYLAVTARALAQPPDTAAEAAANALPLHEPDPLAPEAIRRAALGPPSLGYRLRAALSWPSLTLITLARVALALVLAGVLSHALGDRHAFWPVLVVVMVLSYPGDQHALARRALQRCLGTLLGVGLYALYALLAPAALPPVALALVLCALLWCVSRLAARNYLVGSIFITLLALALTGGLGPQEMPLQLAAARGLDTLLGAGLALGSLWLLGPRWTAALAQASSRRIAQATLRVLDHMAAGQDLLDPGFAEDRRRLQACLLQAGAAQCVASRAQARRAQPWLELERACARTGYLTLGLRWGPQWRQHAGQIAAAQARYRALTRMPWKPFLLAPAQVQALGAAVSDVLGGLTDAPAAATQPAA